MSTLPLETLEEIFHPAMNSPTEWRPVRYEIDMDESTGLPESLVVAFRSADGQQKKLKFSQPRFSDFGSMSISAARHLYIADLSSLGWESQQQIEVGEWEEERPTMFWATSVEEVT